MTYRKLTFVDRAECFDCGTGYGKSGPVSIYLDCAEKIVLCDECAEKCTFPIEVTEDNYFDIAEALHAVLTVWHDGGRGYALLCRSQFKPGMGWSESNVEEENEYYAEIEELYEKGTNFEAMEYLLDEIDAFLDNRED